MNSVDERAFAEMWRAAWQNLGKTITAAQLKLSFAALAEYSIDQIRWALTRHIKDPIAGKYPPIPAHIVAQIDGTPPTADEVIAAARLAQTPLGVLAKAHIGSWDLSNLDHYQLRARGAECLQLMPSWQEKIRTGAYSDHEKRLMNKYQITDTTNARLTQQSGPKQLQAGNA